MSYFLDVDDEWNQIHPKDLWAYNKLSLSRLLGYTCGPSGTTVPKTDFYIVRPCINLLGMGRFASKEWIELYTDHIHPAEFWCEIFEGEHLSVDFYQKKSKLPDHLEYFLYSKALCYYPAKHNFVYKPKLYRRIHYFA